MLQNRNTSLVTNKALTPPPHKKKCLLKVITFLILSFCFFYILPIYNFEPQWMSLGLLYTDQKKVNITLIALIPPLTLRKK